MPDLSADEISIIQQSAIKTVGKNIRSIREKKNLTQTELAGMILSDRQYLYKIESGKVGISVAKLMVIAVALQVDVKELF